MTPTARTLQALRADGWTAEVVERWIPGANVRRDLWGIGDVLAMRADALLLVQCTSRANVSARIRKAQAEPRLRTWLHHASRRFEIWGWGKRQGRWNCRVVPVVLNGDYLSAAAEAQFHAPTVEKFRPAIAPHKPYRAGWTHNRGTMGRSSSGTSRPSDGAAEQR